MDDGNTCIGPEIRYQSTEGGIPREPDMPPDVFCQQLGFQGFAALTTGPRPCEAPDGLVFWCEGYDEPGGHWCDWQDGFWRSASLDWHDCGDDMITSISCF